MAKSIEQEDLGARRLATTNRNDQSSAEDDAEFLRSLDQKQAEALHLSKELAAWFGDHCGQPVRM